MAATNELREAATTLRRRAAGTGSEVDLALADTFDAVAKAARFGDDTMGRLGYRELLAVARLILAGTS